MTSAALAPDATGSSRDFASAVLGGRRLTAIIHPDNQPSQRVAEKIGLTPEKRTRDRTGKDVVLYAADW
jgi:RimJ/RimL family protein N-acetyltransferase